MDDDGLNAAESAIVAEAREFVRDHVAHNAASWEVERRFPMETFQAAADRGFCGLMVPRELGGVGLRIYAAMRVLEEIAAGCFALAFSLEVQNNAAAGLVYNGSDDQIARHLSGLVCGDVVGAFLLTEPHTGSDATAITTTATRDGAGWRIDGEKAWVTNGAVAGLLAVYAQTDASLGWRGIACFLVGGDNPGVSRLPAYGLMGGHAMAATGLVFDNCRIGADAMYRAPGDGFKSAMTGINIARVGVSALCCGMLRASLDCALDYAANRRAFGQATLDFQGLQWMLADVATDLEASRCLVEHAAAAVGAGGGAVAAAHAKKFATRVTLKGVADCMQAMGAAGLRAEYPLGRHLACAKIAQFLDGTSEIQNLVIARDLIRRQREG